MPEQIYCSFKQALPSDFNMTYIYLLTNTQVV